MQILTFQSMVLKNWCLLISSTPSGPAPTKTHNISQDGPAGGDVTPKHDITDPLTFWQKPYILFQQLTAVCTGGNNAFFRDYFQQQINPNSVLLWVCEEGVCVWLIQNKLQCVSFLDKNQIKHSEENKTSTDMFDMIDYVLFLTFMFHFFMFYVYLLFRLHLNVWIFKCFVHKTKTSLWSSFNSREWFIV